MSCLQPVQNAAARLLTTSKRPIESLLFWPLTTVSLSWIQISLMIFKAGHRQASCCCSTTDQSLRCSCRFCWLFLTHTDSKPGELQASVHWDRGLDLKPGAAETQRKNECRSAQTNRNNAHSNISVEQMVIWLQPQCLCYSNHYYTVVFQQMQKNPNMISALHNMSAPHDNCIGHWKTHRSTAWYFLR